jgi:hypothetical protein
MGAQHVSESGRMKKSHDDNRLECMIIVPVMTPTFSLRNVHYFFNWSVNKDSRLHYTRQVFTLCVHWIPIVLTGLAFSEASTVIFMSDPYDGNVRAST